MASERDKKELVKDHVCVILLSAEEEEASGSPVLRGFRIERKLKQGALYLYVGNGVRAQVEAIGSFDLVLPNGLVICLDNCHYAPTITRGVVSVSRLVDNGFVQCFTDCGISVSKNGVLYFNVVPRNGIYEIDMHDLVPNVNSIYIVSNKRVLLLHKHNKINGVYEREPVFTRYGVRSMMNLTTLPLSFWDYALESATRILNMVPTKKVDKTYNETVVWKVLNLSYLKVWGCEALVKRDTPDKLEQRSVKCIFIGYPKETMGYYFYFPPENKIVVARYAEFLLEDLIMFKKKSVVWAGRFFGNKFKKKKIQTF
ncbi:hypothetical protein Tco_0455268 [Tanacetum coccineum]